MPLFTLFLAQPARRRLPVRTCLGALVAAAIGAGTAGTTMAAEVDTAQPELLCTLRMAAETRLVRIGMQTDPYAPVGVAIGEQRFQFRAILNAGAPAGRASASITVSDLESESAPVVLQHASWSVSMAPSPALLQSSDTWVPALTGWQRVYSPRLGRELTWGCALVVAGAVPEGAREADGTMATPSPRGLERRATPDGTEPVVKVAWMGDIMLADGPGRLIRRGGNPFRAVASRLAAADLRVGNLECVIARRGQALAKPWTFRAHPRVLPLLQRHVDVVSLANNHSGDFGPDAFVDMLERLDRAGLTYVGGGRDLKAAHAIKVVERKGVRIAILGFNEMFPRRFEAGDRHPGIAWIEDEQVLHDIRLARTQADIVIPFMHWGQEGETSAHARQRALARRMIDAGADAVVGAHPHVVQDTEVIDGRPVFYSLGNFVFDGFSDRLSRTGALLWLDVTRNGIISWRMESVLLDRQGTPHPVAR